MKALLLLTLGSTLIALTGTCIASRAQQATNSSQTPLVKGKAPSLELGRAVQNFKNGKPNGYKLIEVLPGGLGYRLGLRTGDILLDTGLFPERLQRTDGDPDMPDPKNFGPITIIRNGKEIRVNEPQKGGR
ncbi:MAG: hypothetical protein IT285_01120 [Bdellovibrionales bacterium]|nr:hypothetical protein [Bdellovibrionales bacterium]